MREIGSVSTEWRGELLSPIGSQWSFGVRINGLTERRLFFADNLDEAVDEAVYLLLIEMSWGN